MQPDTADTDHFDVTKLLKAATSFLYSQLYSHGVRIPVPMNITWYFSPSAACTWFTMMRVNAAPLHTSRGFLSFGKITSSMRGLSLMN